MIYGPRRKLEDEADNSTHSLSRRSNALLTGQDSMGRHLCLAQGPFHSFAVIEILAMLVSMRTVAARRCVP